MKTLINKTDLMNKFYNYFSKEGKAVLLVGDMGFSALDEYFKNYPNRVFNIGITEQATIGIAAGMGITGLKPYIYSQAHFTTMRCFEQLRYDLNEHNIPVKIIGVGANNYFEKLGRSHCVDEDDKLIVSVLKKFLIIEPTVNTIDEDIKKLIYYNGPVYLRCT